jgi:hypothetical protein
VDPATLFCAQERHSSHDVQTIAVDETAKNGVAHLEVHIRKGNSDQSVSSRYMKAVDLAKQHHELGINHCLISAALRRRQSLLLNRIEYAPPKSKTAISIQLALASRSFHELT